MAEISTFIKIDRNITNWRWYSDANTVRVFLDLLLHANVSDKDFLGITIRRGEVATSYRSIADRLELSIQNVRTAIAHLKLTGEITVTRHSKFQVISIVCYSKYQDKPTRKSTGNQHSSNIQSTLNQQQYKNNKNIKNEKKDSGTTAAPLNGERPPAFGDDGDEYIEIDGFLHRFPKVWYGFAEKNNMSIEDYVRKRHR